MMNMIGSIAKRLFELPCAKVQQLQQVVPDSTSRKMCPVQSSCQSLPRLEVSTHCMHLTVSLPGSDDFLTSGSFARLEELEMVILDALILALLHD